MVSMAFPNASVFVPYVQPKGGHATNLHYNSTEAYNVMNILVKDKASKE